MDLTPTQRLKNAAWAWAIVGVFVLLFVGTLLVALLYLAADNN